jgi:hypothetical protein
MFVLLRGFAASAALSFRQSLSVSSVVSVVISAAACSYFFISITPPPIRPPALPVGWVFRSSCFA